MLALADAGIFIRIIHNEGEIIMTAHDIKWVANFNAFKVWMNENDRLPSGTSKDADERKLYMWRRNQIVRHSKGLLEDNRVAELNSYSNKFLDINFNLKAERKVPELEILSFNMGQLDLGLGIKLIEKLKGMGFCNIQKLIDTLSIDTSRLAELSGSEVCKVVKAISNFMNKGRYTEKECSGYAMVLAIAFGHSSARGEKEDGVQILINHNDGLRDRLIKSMYKFVPREMLVVILKCYMEESIESIGQLTGMSSVRCRQIFVKSMRKLRMPEGVSFIKAETGVKKQPEDHYGFSVKTYNILRRANIEEEELRERLEAANGTKEKLEYLSTIRGMAKGSASEILKVMGYFEKKQEGDNEKYKEELQRKRDSTLIEFDAMCKKAVQLVAAKGS